MLSISQKVQVLKKYTKWNCAMYQAKVPTQFMYSLCCTSHYLFKQTDYKTVKIVILYKMGY